MTPTDEVPRKATLFCPECGHASHVSGDWRVRDGARARRIVCPECHTTVTTRPSFDDDDDPVTAWLQACRSWLVVWTPWIDDRRVTG